MISPQSPIVLTLSSNIISKRPTTLLPNKLTDWEVSWEVVNAKIDLKIQTTSILPNRPTEIMYPKVILEKVKELKRARHNWQRSRSPNDKTYLKRISAGTKQLVWKNNESTFNHFISSLDTTKDTKFSLWKVCKEAKKPQSYIPPIRKPNGTWARKDEDKAEVLTKHLETVFQANDIDTDLNPIITHREGPAIKFCSPKEVRHVITKLKANKAPGHDMITVHMLKVLPRKGMVLLTSIYNSILRLSYFPNE